MVGFKVMDELEVGHGVMIVELVVLATTSCLLSGGEELDGILLDFEGCLVVGEGVDVEIGTGRKVTALLG